MGDMGEMTKYGTYCGREAPDLITITSDTAEVHLATDSSFIGKGFRLEWQMEGCGGVIRKPSGNISSPGYPNVYPDGKRCDWVIEVEYGKSIEIWFTDVDFETSPTCAYDYVLVTLLGILYMIPIIRGFRLKTGPMKPIRS